MRIHEDFVDIPTANGPMRTFIYRPANSGRYPGIVFFSEIFQVTGPIQRTARQFASQGYIVAVPEVYHEFEAPGTPFEYNAADSEKGNRYKVDKPIPNYDEDARCAIRYLQQLDYCTGKIGSLGICLGGHLAFRCAMNPEVSATVCFYATDIHKRSLGLGQNDDSLARIADIQGELMMIWGRQDPHISQEGRDLIRNELTRLDRNYTWHEFNGEHAFMRDEGPRYNPAIARIGLELAFEVFQRRLQLAED